MKCQILGASWFSTHHASASDALAGRERSFSAPTFDLLVGRARRFTSLVTQMQMEVCGALLARATQPPIAVFATCHGEIQTAEKLIADFHDNAVTSSARFALSVHNTPSGILSVATTSNAPTTTVTGANAVAAGWLEAVLTVLDSERTVLLAIADEPVPAMFQGPTEPVGYAAAFLIAPGDQAELAITSPNDTQETTLHALARAVDASTRGQSATIELGRIQPARVLELRL